MATGEVAAMRPMSAERWAYEYSRDLVTFRTDRHYFSEWRLYSAIGLPAEIHSRRDRYACGESGDYRKVYGPIAITPKQIVLAISPRMT